MKTCDFNVLFDVPPPEQPVFVVFAKHKTMLFYMDEALTIPSWVGLVWDAVPTEV